MTSEVHFSDAEPGSEEIKHKYDFKKQASLFLEKVLSTFIQNFLTFLIGMNALGADAMQAAGLAALAAAGTAGLAALPLVPDNLPFATDLFFRTVRSFLVTFGTLYFAAGDAFQLTVSGAQTAAFAGIMAALAVAKGLLAKHYGNGETAALLSNNLDPAPTQFAIAA